ncbi:MAG: hypothetical protein ACOYN5_03505 [Bacteroidales bacterium]
MNTVLPISIKSEIMTWSETEFFFEGLGRKLNIEETILPGMISLTAEIHDFIKENCEVPGYGISAFVFEKEVLIRFQFNSVDYNIIKRNILDAEQRIGELVKLIADSFTFQDELNNVDFAFVYKVSTERVQEERRKVLRSFYQISKIAELHNDKV